MSEEKDQYSDEEPIWEGSSEAPKDTIYDHPTETQLPQSQPIGVEIDPELATKKKRRRTIIIVIFAIVLPAVLVLVGIGLLIWGMVVGFTNCCNSCESCFTGCFGCCDGCFDCLDNCASCTNSCDNCCGNTIDNSTTAEQINKVSSFKLALQNFISLLKWYYYSLYQFLQSIFGR
ncbi:MAG: hypothetical protein FK733_15675 [Asgard group archaeon]|nr:hypothetical protein [Asgard group archaeon]